MRVVEKGNAVPKGQWSIEVRCLVCQSLLEVSESDLKFRWDHVSNETPTDYSSCIASFSCPECETVSVIYYKNIPLYVRKRNNCTG